MIILIIINKNIYCAEFYYKNWPRICPVQINNGFTVSLYEADRKTLFSVPHSEIALYFLCFGWFCYNLPYFCCFIVTMIIFFVSFCCVFNFFVLMQSKWCVGYIFSNVVC